MKLLIHSHTSIEFWEWIRNFISHFTGRVITCMLGLKFIHISTRSSWNFNDISTPNSMTWFKGKKQKILNSFKHFPIIFLRCMSPDSLIALNPIYKTSDNMICSLVMSIWQHRTGSILAQVMVCFLMAPTHYLNKCWLLSGEAAWHSTESNFIPNTQATILYNKLEIYR